MIVHFVSYQERRAACGAFLPPIEADPRRGTEDHVLVTCGSCTKAINKAGRTGEMIFNR